MTPESVTHFCQKVDTHQTLSKNWKISVPLSAASFLLCYMSQFVIKIRHTDLVDIGGLLNDLSTLLLISTQQLQQSCDFLKH